MRFRLAIVGHGSSIEEIAHIISEKFDDVESVGIELASDEMAESAAQKLKDLFPKLDGVLYTRREPYQLMVSRLDHSGVFARYVDIGAASFVQSLLRATLKYHVDIFSVSVDTLDYGTVMSAYRSLEIPSDSARPVMVKVNTNAEHFVEAAIQTHREIYRSGMCSACITNIRSVQDILEKEDIPCALMTPSPDTYISEIRRLILHRQVVERAKENTTIVRIRAELDNDYYLHEIIMVQKVQDLGRLSEMIALFAQQVNGAFIHMGDQDFVIVCAYDELSHATEQFTRLELLAQAYTYTPYRLAVGIGMGGNLQKAMANAELGTQHAWMEGGNRAYVIQAENRVLGPIQPNELLTMQQPQFDRRLIEIAHSCALSLNTIVKIDIFIRKKNNGSFITAELAQELRVSFRTASRIIEKLERSGHIVEIGQRSINGRGRPTRVFRLLW